jgi:hypothetical protein
MNIKTRKTMIEEILKSIEIPLAAYEKAIQRYEDLGKWFGRKESKCYEYDPHIYAQGSFRLGTVVSPLKSKDDYDLDAGCRLRKGIKKNTHTQKYLKELIGEETEAYRQARQIQNRLLEKDRCWRLQYADELSFHLDVVPSIPEDTARRQVLQKSIIEFGSTKDSTLAASVANLTGAITDKKHPGYPVIHSDWRNSNSEGYALWFESRMRLATFIQKRAMLEAKAAQVDPLPARNWNSPLQQCIKILKRHRDIMFQENPDRKPISIIITTLAAAAYEGEEELENAMQTILSRMGRLVQPQGRRVPNPVNPEEDFADKWATASGIRLNLEKNFWDWLKRAQTDFGDLGASDDSDFLVERAISKYGATLNASELRKKLRVLGATVLTTGSGLAQQKPKAPVDLQGGGRNA